MGKWSHLVKIFRSGGEQPFKKCTHLPLTNFPSTRLSNFANFILWIPQIPKCPCQRISGNLKSWCRTSNWVLSRTFNLWLHIFKGLQSISKVIYVLPLSLCGGDTFWDTFWYFLPLSLWGRGTRVDTKITLFSRLLQAAQKTHICFIFVFSIYRI